MSDMAERPLNRPNSQPEAESSRKHAWLALLGCSLLQLPIWGMYSLAEAGSSTLNETRRCHDLWYLPNSLYT